MEGCVVSIFAMSDGMNPLCAWELGEACTVLAKMFTEPVVLDEISISPMAAEACHKLEKAPVARALSHLGAWHLGVDTGGCGLVATAHRAIGWERERESAQSRGQSHGVSEFSELVGKPHCWQVK